ncbi:MAG: 5-methyltetrahydropteroyltriglutamate--homocysteine S-methyltransferase [Nitrospiraceae bacterium]|nr:5-methyltetrahydropteroyltriglutamate--homocysteine S-methyltransferase [Nitrospiraceae bacterium]
MTTHLLGFPRIGVDRDLKKGVEAYWKGQSSEEALLALGKELRQRHWNLQRDQGIDLIPVGDFSYYDQILDATAMLGAVPERFDWDGDMVGLATYFKMPRGYNGVKAMEMTKWFNTNYHYLVPEFAPGQTFTLSSTKVLDELAEAKAAGLTPKVVLPGPLTYIHIGKETEPGFDRWTHLDAILTVYEEVVQRLAGECDWVQLDEPILVLDLPEAVRERFAPAYERLKKAAGDARVMVASYFGALRENEDVAAKLPVDALHVDLLADPDALDTLAPKLPASMALSVGVVNGRNIWRVKADASVRLVERAVDALGAERVLVAPTCSLLHVPLDLDRETALDPEVRSWMAFAKQKCAEVRLIADAASGQDVTAAMTENETAHQSRANSPAAHNEAVCARVAGVTDDQLRRATPHAQRKQKQQASLNLPLLPTTTIGSFPQTADIRRTRRQFKKGELGQAEYTAAMQAFIKDAVDRQHELDLDVLVHGEPERNDMVEYFGELLDGFCFTSNGWVQSYGSRCVKPPVIYGDVSRPNPMTVDWITYAQSLTDKPMKGMLTGPVTILCWSFVRDDQPRGETCRQIALGIHDEVQDLEKAGVPIIQIDEAALREGLPLRRGDWDTYLEWATDAFRLTTSGVRDETQIHTHMCYSEFNEILLWIARMDADVISIEASRSNMDLLQAFRDYEYPNDIGPGVYDIHSPRVPSEEEVKRLLSLAQEVIAPERLWVNPDCGLKTRDWPETLDALRHMVAAAKDARAAVAAG